jgi:hypothetical protein
MVKLAAMAAAAVAVPRMLLAHFSATSHSLPVDLVCPAQPLILLVAYANAALKANCGVACVVVEVAVEVVVDASSVIVQKGLRLDHLPASVN